jgi:hypothetical protein
MRLARYLLYPMATGMVPDYNQTKRRYEDESKAIDGNGSSGGGIRPDYRSNHCQWIFCSFSSTDGNITIGRDENNPVIEFRDINADLHA